MALTDLLLVVGAAGGIGSACLRRLRAEHEAALAVDLPSCGRPDDVDGVRWFEGDITNSSERAAAVDAVVAMDLPLRTVVLASGVPHRGGLAECTSAAWRRVLDVNVVGPAAFATELLLRARWARSGSIVGIGSLSARRSLPARALYGASKAAFEHFLRGLALEVAARSIAVSVVSPGVTDTRFLSSDRQSLERYVTSRVPAQRMARADEVAEAVAMATRLGMVMTGATVSIDGGAGVAG